MAWAWIWARRAARIAANERCVASSTVAVGVVAALLATRIGPAGRVGRGVATATTAIGAEAGGMTVAGGPAGVVASIVTTGPVIGWEGVNGSGDGLTV